MIIRILRITSSSNNDSNTMRKIVIMKRIYNDNSNDAPAVPLNER